MNSQIKIFSGSASKYLAEKITKGSVLVIAPEEELQRVTISSKNNDLELWDGRSNHNNGWFIVRSLISSGATKNAIEWTITPNTIPNWIYKPVVRVFDIP